MSDRFEVVPFHERQILTVRQKDGVFVVMKPIVEQLGLTWQGQHRRITQHPVVRKGINTVLIPSAGGMQEMLCLHLEAFHGWLVTLDPRQIRDDARREAIMLYQESAFRVIYEHHHGKMGAVRVTAQSARATILLQNQYLKLMDKLVVTADTGRRQALYSLINALGEQLGSDVPALADLGQEAPQAPDILKDFWHTYDILQERGQVVNFARKPDLIAVNLPVMRAAIAAEKLDFHIGTGMGAVLEQSQSPKFIANKAVNRKGGSTVKCYVFQRFP